MTKEHTPSALQKASGLVEVAREIAGLIRNGENQKAWNTWHLWCEPLATELEKVTKERDELRHDNEKMRIALRKYGQERLDILNSSHQ